jgi:hypothetical protein
LDDDNIVTIINYKQLRTRSSRFLPSSPENMAPLTPSATFAAVLTMAQASFTAMQAQMIALQAQLSLLEQLHHSENVSPPPDRHLQHKTSSEHTIASASFINTLPPTVHTAATTCKCGNTITPDAHHDRFIKTNGLPARKRCHVCCTTAKLAKAKSSAAPRSAAKNKNKINSRSKKPATPRIVRTATPPRTDMPSPAPTSSVTTPIVHPATSPTVSQPAIAVSTTTPPLSWAQRVTFPPSSAIVLPPPSISATAGNEADNLAAKLLDETGCTFIDGAFIFPPPATPSRPPLPPMISPFDNPWLPGTPLTDEEVSLPVEEYLRHFNLTPEEYSSRFNRPCSLYISSSANIKPNCLTLTELTDF